MKSVIINAGKTVAGVKYFEDTPRDFSDNYAEHLVTQGAARWADSVPAAKIAGLSGAQQAIVDQLRAGYVIRSVSLGNRSSASISNPAEAFSDKTVSMATLRALSDKGLLVRYKDGHHSTWTLAK